jgi:hypothetical protein
MATIKLQGNSSGSGSVILKAPNTNSTRTLTLPDGDGILGNSPSYNSGEITYSAGITTVSHGLGRMPYFWRVHVRCKIAQNGYSVGDEIDVTNMVDGDGARGYVSWASTTQIKYSIDTINLQNTNADYAGTTAANFRLVFYAW